MPRFVGIDEAGYGPNLGPLVMAAVVAEGPGPRPDVWGDRPATVSKAGGPERRLWVDDSKKVHAGRRGRDRLEAGLHAALKASGHEPTLIPETLLEALGAGTVESTEWARWSDPRAAERFPQTNPHWSIWERASPLQGENWRIVAVHAEVVGPERFNEGLSRHVSKASVHFEAFARLLARCWGEGQTFVHSDKHGGRNSYGPCLNSAFPCAIIATLDESPQLGRYALEEGGNPLVVSFEPRADVNDGLVALASLVAKSLRELWMDQFNAFWAARAPGLRPTAGYPTDAARFRREVEGTALALGPPPPLWWRER